MNIKKYKVIILPNFKRELYKIFGDTLEYSKPNTILTLITKKLEHLQNMPYMYAIIENCDELGRVYRKISVKSYIILYTIEEKKEHVYISHIFYKKSNYHNKL